MGRASGGADLPVATQTPGKSASREHMVASHLHPASATPRTGVLPVAGTKDPIKSPDPGNASLSSPKASKNECESGPGEVEHQQVARRSPSVSLTAPTLDKPASAMKPQEDQSAAGYDEISAVCTGESASVDRNAIVHLDPRSIRPSRWANRHPRSFESRDFDELRASIAEAGINIQAIKVRPIASALSSAGEPPGDVATQFELVFGHRRHRACLELGLPIAAVVEPMSDRDLFSQMDQENRNRRPLAPFEQGSMFKAALDTQLYSTASALSQGLGIDPSIVSKALSIVRLPDEVVHAFGSPLDIQYRWAGPLNEAYRKDPGALLARAQLLQADRMRLSAVKIFQRLVAHPQPQNAACRRITGRRGSACIEVDPKGRLQVVVDTPWAPSLRERLENVLQRALNDL